MYSRLIFMAVVLVASTVTCLAQQVEPVNEGFYITPLVYAVRTDNDRSVDDDTAVSLATGVQLHRNWNAELSLFRGRFDGAGGDNLQMDAIGVNALRVFRRDARVTPYLLFGLGSLRKDRSVSGSSTDAYADAGTGLLTRLRRAEDSGQSLSLRIDLRARYDDRGSRWDHMLGIGLQYAFGAGSRARASAPIPVAVPAPLEDRAPDDGAFISDDCPPGARIGASGCEIEQEEIRLPVVTFAFDSDRLDATATAALDEAIETLRMHPDVHIEVAGHTDSMGSDAYNLALSQRRAETVHRYFVDNGATNTLTVRGYGEREPTADNSTAAGRAQNRRVVLRILSR